MLILSEMSSDAIYSYNSFLTYAQRLNVQTFIYRHLQGNQNSSGLQFEVAY